MRPEIRRITAMDFRRQRSWFDKVHHTGIILVITKRGRDHVAVVPVDLLSFAKDRPAVRLSEPKQRRTVRRSSRGGRT